MKKEDGVLVAQPHIFSGVHLLGLYNGCVVAPTSFCVKVTNPNIKLLWGSQLHVSTVCTE